MPTLYKNCKENEFTGLIRHLDGIVLWQEPQFQKKKKKKKKKKKLLSPLKFMFFFAYKYSCQPHIAKLYRRTPLIFSYYCRPKTILYNSSALIQVEAQLFG